MARAFDATIELRSRAELPCLVGASGGSALDAAGLAAIARDLGASHVEIAGEIAGLDTRAGGRGEHVIARVADPVDALVAAHALATAGARLSMIAAGARAADFIRADGGEPARVAVAWLVEDVRRRADTCLASPTGWLAIDHFGGMLWAPLPADADAALAAPPSGAIVVAPFRVAIHRDIAPIVVSHDAPIVFGRGRDCTIASEHVHISRRHVQLARDPHTRTWFSRDLNSAPGYYVLGEQRGSVPVGLVAGRVLQFGLPVALAILAA